MAAALSPPAMEPNMNRVEKLLIGLLSGLGARFFNHIDKDTNTDTYFPAELYKLTKKITGHGIQDDKLNHCNQEIDNLCKFMTMEYLEAVQEGDDPILRRELLSPRIPILEEITSSISSEQKQCRHLTFELFIFVVSLHLLLLQENIHLDTEDPATFTLRSLGEVRKCAESGVELLKSSYVELVQLRVKQVTELKVESSDIQDQQTFAITWADQLTNTVFMKHSEQVNGGWSHGDPDSLRAECEGNRADHLMNILKEMEKDFKVVNNAIIVWSLLVHNPLSQ